MACGGVHFPCPASARRLRPLVGAEYDLAQARDAHEDLLARRTKGKLVLRP
ncbi:zinc-binding dehydrogenase [Streptomyces sp. NBS 14/10]|uniref:zinc-binding dehydrogenase n=1 Tax=Streptomyces sp. NBS 14/10 TaxID=1945643 RepID=UPI00211B3E88|nr:zinc-binding dehydrogenase [Streptomyces sp. NBS 14/10]KAK1185842.1 zinc-binding dehydrogenase [Streptomyces sp. NBS 14/10]